MLEGGLEGSVACIFGGWVTGQGGGRDIDFKR